MVQRDHKAWLEAVNAGVKPLMGISVPDKNYALYKSISEDFETGWADFEKLEALFGIPVMDICKDLFDQWETGGVINRVGENLAL